MLLLLQMWPDVTPKDPRASHEDGPRSQSDAADGGRRAGVNRDDVTRRRGSEDAASIALGMRAKVNAALLSSATGGVGTERGRGGREGAYSSFSGKKHVKEVRSKRDCQSPRQGSLGGGVYLALKNKIVKDLPDGAEGDFPQFLRALCFFFFEKRVGIVSYLARCNGGKSGPKLRP